MVSVYVAGGSAERFSVREWIDKLGGHGVSVTHDWTRCEGYDRQSTEMERTAWAAQDISAITRATIVWMIVPEGLSEGAFFEAGFATALRKRVIFSGPCARKTSRVFCLTGEVYNDHGAAFAAILRAAANASREVFDG